METTTFTALCERAGRWWTIHVPQIEGLTTQVRDLDQAQVVTRTLISRALGIPPAAIKVDVVCDAPAPVARALQLRYAAQQAFAVATAATRDALDVLARDGVAFHEAARMLGLSPAEIEEYGPRAPAPPAGTGPAIERAPSPLQLTTP